MVSSFFLLGGAGVPSVPVGCGKNTIFEVFDEVMGYVDHEIFVKIPHGSVKTTMCRFMLRVSAFVIKTS